MIDIDRIAAALQAHQPDKGHRGNVKSVRCTCGHVTDTSSSEYPGLIHHQAAEIFHLKDTSDYVDDLDY